MTALLVLSILVCCGAGIAADAMGSDAEPILVRLGMEHFDPLQKYPQAGGMVRFQTAEAGTGEPAYYIVQFDGPIKQAWKEALKDLNAKLLDTFLILRLLSERHRTWWTLSVLSPTFGGWGIISRNTSSAGGS